MSDQTLIDLYKLFLRSNGVCTDTRRLKTGQIYWALKGPRFDGNTFVLQALEQGALAVVSSNPDYRGRDNVYVVSDELSTLQRLATFHRKKLPYNILALTGSNGKTTTKELIDRVLKAKYRVRSTAGNLNNHIGVPLTLLSLPLDLDFAIIEMGANHVGEIADLTRIVRPDAGLITNIGMAHLEGFGGLMGVRKGKGEMYDHLKLKKGVIFYNEDEQFLQDMVGDYPRAISYSDDGAEINQVQLGFKNISESYCGAIVKMNGQEFKIETGLAGSYNYRNLILALTIGFYYNIEIEAMQEALSGFGIDMNRSQMKTVNGVSYILDAYNANPTSMSAALDNLDVYPAKSKGVILGEMLELGDESSYRHQIVLDRLNEIEDLSYALLIGNEFKPFQAEYSFKFFDTVEEAVEVRNSLEEEVDACLIKGSRSNQLEKWFNYML